VVAPRADETSALIVRVALPSPLERLRRAHLPAEMRGLPSHCTLLYPFLAPGSLTRHELRALRALVLRHTAFDIRLAARGSWPEVLYVAIDPDPALDALQAELAAMFPSLPLYGGGVPFVPHVTIVAGSDAGRPALADHAAWQALPVTVGVRAVELIAADDRRWRLRRRFRLSGAGAGAGRHRAAAGDRDRGVSRDPRRRGGS
jgi:2'-5' RNA ligase